MQKPAAHGCGRVLGGRTDCKENTLSDRTSQPKGEVFIHRGRLFVNKNWRLTFRIDKTEIEMIDLKRDNGLNY
jgi:hypothetical protein